MKLRKVDRDRWLKRRQRRKHRKAVFRAQSCSLLPKPKPENLLAPPYFSIVKSGLGYAQAEFQFLQFIKAIRTHTGTTLCIDLTNVNRLIVTAALLFKAEVSHLISKGVRVTAIPPKKQRTQQVLTQTGIAELLGLQKCEVIDREDTVHWRHASGAWNMTQPTRLASLLHPEENPESSSLYKGMIESVANCIEHAYQPHPDRRKFFGSEMGWWGFQQLRDGILYTCICDLGIGIAKALPIKLLSEPGLFQSLFSLVKHIKGQDVRSILAAVEYGRSSTGEVQRGKGLRDAHQVIDDAGEGEFHLLSNSGFYWYKREKEKEGGSSGTRRLKGSVAGTIYYWRYPLQLPQQGD